jgi:S-(hydroxymethyl)glutathione dehydrogenase/alcohol dehydrogenase
MPKYVEFYMQGKLRLDEMITRRGHLNDGDVKEAFRAMEAGEVVRTVLTFEG